MPLPRVFLRDNQLGRTLCGRVKQTLAVDLTRSLSGGWTVVSVHRHPVLTVCILGSGCATYSITKVAFRSIGSLKWNVRVVRTDPGQNGAALGSKPISSPASVGQSAGISRVLAGTMYACALDLFT